MAFDAYLAFVGPEVEGEVTRSGFEGRLEIYSFSLGAMNPPTIGPGSAGAGGGRAQLSSFNCTRFVDKASPELFQRCAAGTHFDSVVVSLHEAGGEPVRYLEYTFDNCFIESLHWSGSSASLGDRPTESLIIAYGKVTITYSPQSATGEEDPVPIIGSWDVTTVST